MPPSSETDIRLRKVQDLRAMGVHPYPESYAKTLTIDEAKKQATDSMRSIEEIIPSPADTVSTAGRIVLMRSMGKLAFAHLQDSTGRIQIMFSQENCSLRTGDTLVNAINNPEGITISAYKFLNKYVDMGDFIGIRGELFRTHKGELTIFVKEFTFLSKALRPLPEKFHGIADDEIRYRQRYLDLITSEETMDRFRFRSEFIRLIREFYHIHGFLEIEGQTLTNCPTGAAARPYETHQHALDIDVYLRIAHEIPLKLVNVAGMDRVFEMGKAFRNEGQDPSHLPEHTHLEHNVAYWTYKDNMRFTEEMFDFLFDRMGLSRQRDILDKHGNPVTVDFTTPWRRVDYVELVRTDSGIDVTQYTDADTLRRDIRARGIELPGMDTMGLTTLIDYLYKKVSRPKIVHPTFLYNYPVSLKPFARRNDEHPDTTDAFQLVVNGWELVNSYSELVDPVDQTERFRQQNAALAGGDEEAMRGDNEFVKAMEHGMPPISGWGLGLDRLIALLTCQSNLRDVVLFPLVRPETAEMSRSDAEKLYRSKKIAVIANPDYPAGVVANAIAHVGIMIAGHTDNTLFGEVRKMHGNDGFAHRCNTLYPISNLAGSQEDIVRIMRAAHMKGLLVVDFAEVMARAHRERELIEGYAAHDLDHTPMIACGLYGATADIEEVVKGLSLYGK